MTNEDDGGTTHDYLDALRAKDVFIPELSLVAEDDNGAIIGQVVLCKTVIFAPQGMTTELLLSPICVHPSYFRNGIARAMIEEALRIAKDMGFNAVFLCGNPKIYGRLGFSPSFNYNIFHKNDEARTAEWSMVRELYNGVLNDISGIVDIV
jgi:predicted N-acetyltransferase YhbS